MTKNKCLNCGEKPANKKYFSEWGTCDNQCYAILHGAETEIYTAYDGSEKDKVFDRLAIEIETRRS